MGKENGLLLFFSLPFPIGVIVFLTYHEKVAKWFLYPTNDPDWIAVVGWTTRFPSLFWPECRQQLLQGAMLCPAHRHGNTDGPTKGHPGSSNGRGARSSGNSHRDTLDVRGCGGSVTRGNWWARPGWAVRGQCRGHTQRHLHSGRADDAKTPPK